MQKQMLLVATVSLLLGCQSTVDSSSNTVKQDKPPLPAFAMEPLTEQQITTVDEVFKLTEKQEKDFLTFYHSENQANEITSNRIYNYLESAIRGFNYKTKTFKAAETATHNSGNCLSLAIYTSSLAKLAGLRVDYQRTHTAPLYHREDDVMTLTTHVRTHVVGPTLPVEEDTLFIPSRTIIDYFPDPTNISGDFISKADFISMYYQNIASEALIKKDFHTAHANLVEALKHSPYNPGTINTLGVLFRQMDKNGQAEELYKFAIENTKGSAHLISNYSLLLHMQERHSEANKLSRKIEGIYDDNPYRWIDLGNYYLNKEKYAKAIKTFNQAIKVAPYLDHAHIGLARSYHLSGNPQKAKQAVIQAIQLAYEDDSKKLYKAKLKSMSVNLEEL